MGTQCPTLAWCSERGWAAGAHCLRGRGFAALGYRQWAGAAYPGMPYGSGVGLRAERGWAPLPFRLPRPHPAAVGYDQRTGNRAVDIRHPSLALRPERRWTDSSCWRYRGRRSLLGGGVRYEGRRCGCEALCAIIGIHISRFLCAAIWLSACKPLCAADPVLPSASACSCAGKQTRFRLWRTGRADPEHLHLDLDFALAPAFALDLVSSRYCACSAAYCSVGSRETFYLTWRYGACQSYALYHCSCADVMQFCPWRLSWGKVKQPSLRAILPSYPLSHFNFSFT